jgi:hypothetical protein
MKSHHNDSRAVRQTAMIDRFAQGFARRSINERTAAPTKTKYEGSPKRKISPPVNQKRRANRAADNQ